MLLSNRYRITEELGEGGFGKTYLGVDTQLPDEPRCVIKELKPVAGLDANEVVKRFEQEAKTLHKLGKQHPQIPQLYAYFAHEGKFYLVQEYIEGETLSKRIAHNGPLSELEAYQLLCQILSVLCYVHGENVIHRDIKPDNIILREGDNAPVLIDFGAVKEKLGAVGGGADTGAGSRSIAIGTLGFMPMEQAIGRPVFASDLFSLGITTIYALTAKPPETMSTHPRSGVVEWQTPEAPVNVSSKLSTVLDRAIQPHQSERYDSAEEMLSALQAIDATRPFNTVEAATQTIPATIASSPSIVPPTTIPETVAASGPAAIPETTISDAGTASHTPAKTIFETTVDTSRPQESADDVFAPAAGSSVPPHQTADANTLSSPSPTPSRNSWVPIAAIGVPVALVAGIAVLALRPDPGDNPPEGFSTPPEFGALREPNAPSAPEQPGPNGADIAFLETEATCGEDYCEIEVEPGFVPDPHIGTGNIGGPMLAADLTGVANTPLGKCLAYVDTAPDHMLILSDRFEYLAIGVETEVPMESSIVIVYPDGSANCFSEFDPIVEGEWPAGVYELYVGNLVSAGVGPRYRLFVTEISP